MTTWTTVNRLAPLFISLLFFVIAPAIIVIKLKGMKRERDSWKRFASMNGLQTEEPPAFSDFLANPGKYPHYPMGRVYGEPKPGARFALHYTKPPAVRDPFQQNRPGRDKVGKAWPEMKITLPGMREDVSIHDENQPRTDVTWTAKTTVSAAEAKELAKPGESVAAALKRITLESASRSQSEGVRSAEKKLTPAVTALFLRLTQDGYDWRLEKGQLIFRLEPKAGEARLAEAYQRMLGFVDELGAVPKPSAALH